MNKFYTAQEVADKLKIKKTTVYELIKRDSAEAVSGQCHTARFCPDSRLPAGEFSSEKRLSESFQRADHQWPVLSCTGSSSEPAACTGRKPSGASISYEYLQRTVLPLF